MGSRVGKRGLRVIYARYIFQRQQQCLRRLQGSAGTLPATGRFRRKHGLFRSRPDLWWQLWKHHVQGLQGDARVVTRQLVRAAQVHDRRLWGPGVRPADGPFGFIYGPVRRISRIMDGRCCVPRCRRQVDSRYHQWYWKRICRNRADQHHHRSEGCGDQRRRGIPTDAQ